MSFAESVIFNSSSSPSLSGLKYSGVAANVSAGPVTSTVTVVAAVFITSPLVYVTVSSGVYTPSRIAPESSRPFQPCVAGTFDVPENVFCATPLSSFNSSFQFSIPSFKRRRIVKVTRSVL